MPYIVPGDRAGLRPHATLFAVTPGELNFQITTLIERYYAHRGPGYTVINDVLGALEGAKLEFYRRVAAPYEDVKIRDNGDVYPRQETDPPDSKNTPLENPTGPLCGAVLAGWGDDLRPFVCGLALGHVGQHTYWRKHRA